MIESLSSLCIRVLQNHIPNYLTVPPQFIPTILKFCTASKLRLLEYTNEDIKPETDMIWKDLILRDFTFYTLVDGTDYRKVYVELETAEEDKKRKIAIKLRNLRQQEQDRKQSRQAVLIDPKKLTKKRKAGVLDKLKKDVYKRVRS